jgi:hypothetical protein
LLLLHNGFPSVCPGQPTACLHLLILHPKKGFTLFDSPTLSPSPTPHIQTQRSIIRPPRATQYPRPSLSFFQRNNGFPTSTNRSHTTHASETGRVATTRPLVPNPAHLQLHQLGSSASNNLPCACRSSVEPAELLSPQSGYPKRACPSTRSGIWGSRKIADCRRPSASYPSRAKEE